MSGDAGTAGEATLPDGELPAAFAEALVGYERYLRAERGHGPHTRRAYLGDARSLLTFAASAGGLDRLDALDLPLLRAWLADLLERGHARSTMARRAAGARAFTAWAHRTGRVPVDPGVRLRAPRAHRSLPAVLTRDQAADLLRAAAERVNAAPAAPASEGERLDVAVALRDLAAVEILYATGIRVGELVGLDLPALDRERRLMRVRGKGDRERVVPYGVPAAQRLGSTSGRAGRGSCASGSQGAGALPRPPRSTGRRAPDPRGGRPPGRLARGRPALGPHGLRHSAATHLLDGGADLRTRPGVAWSRYAVDDSALHPRLGGEAPCKLPTGAPPRAEGRPPADRLTAAARQAHARRASTPVAANEAALRALWEHFKETGDAATRERLILHYAPLVKYVAGRVGVGLPQNIEQADLVSYGIFGLIDAIEKFDIDRAIKFETYAISRIRGAIIDELRAIDWIPRSVRSKAREVERAYAALEGELRRTPTEAEVAAAPRHRARRPAPDLRPGLVRQRRRARRAAQRRRREGRQALAGRHPRGHQGRGPGHGVRGARRRSSCWRGRSTSCPSARRSS